MYFLLETKIISIQIPVSGRFCHAVLAVRDVIFFTECGETSNNREIVYIQHKEAGQTSYHRKGNIPLKLADRVKEREKRESRCSGGEGREEVGMK